MTALDIAALAVLLLSVLLAWARGIIRSLIGTVAWIAGFVAAIGFAPTVGLMLPGTISNEGGNSVTARLRSTVASQVFASAKSGRSCKTSRSLAATLSASSRPR